MSKWTERPDDGFGYDPIAEHWVNNPLITPVNKVAMFDEAIAYAKKQTEERIIELLDDAKSSYKLPISSQLFQQIRALIKGEN